MDGEILERHEACSCAGARDEHDREPAQEACDGHEDDAGQKRHALDGCWQREHSATNDGAEHIQCRDGDGSVADEIRRHFSH